MKQITDKLNDIAKAIDESVELPTSDLIVDSLDAITKAFGGTPSESDLIVDKLDDIAKVATGGGGGSVPCLTINVEMNGLEYYDWSEFMPDQTVIAKTENIFSMVETEYMGGYEEPAFQLVYQGGTITDAMGCLLKNYIVPTDMVNCSLGQNGSYKEVAITDASKDSSLTITLENDA